MTFDAKTYKAKWYRDNKERVNALNKAWKEAHPERTKEISLAYKQKNRQKIRDAENFRNAMKRKERMAIKSLPKITWWGDVISNSR